MIREAVYCVSRDGRAYAIEFATIAYATGEPRYLVRCHDGAVHRLAVGATRAKLRLPKLCLLQLEAIAPTMTAEESRRIGTEPGTNVLRRPAWIKVRRPGA